MHKKGWFLAILVFTAVFLTACVTTTTRYSTYASEDEVAGISYEEEYDVALYQPPIFVGTDIVRWGYFYDGIYTNIYVIERNGVRHNHHWYNAKGSRVLNYEARDLHQQHFRHQKREVMEKRHQEKPHQARQAPVKKPVHEQPAQVQPQPQPKVQPTAKQPAKKQETKKKQNEKE